MTWANTMVYLADETAGRDNAGGTVDERRQVR
jgi:hypothetical protein